MLITPIMLIRDIIVTKAFRPRDGKRLLGGWLYFYFYFLLFRCPARIHIHPILNGSLDRNDDGGDDDDDDNNDKGLSPLFFQHARSQYLVGRHTAGVHDVGSSRSSVSKHLIRPSMSSLILQSARSNISLGGLYTR